MSDLAINSNKRSEFRRPQRVSRAHEAQQIERWQYTVQRARTASVLSHEVRENAREHAATGESLSNRGRVAMNWTMGERALLGAENRQDGVGAYTCADSHTRVFEGLSDLMTGGQPEKSIVFASLPTPAVCRDPVAGEPELVALAPEQQVESSAEDVQTLSPGKSETGRDPELLPARRSKVVSIDERSSLATAVTRVESRDDEKPLTFDIFVDCGVFNPHSSPQMQATGEPPVRQMLDEVLERLDAVVRMAGFGQSVQGEAEFTIVLQPDVLGGMTLRVRLLDRARVSLRAKVDNASLASLESRLSSLTAALAARGIQVAELALGCVDDATT